MLAVSEGLFTIPVNNRSIMQLTNESSKIGQIDKKSRDQRAKRVDLERFVYFDNSFVDPRRFRR